MQLLENSTLTWLKNPSYTGGEFPTFYVGDRVLIAVPLSGGGYDFEVIVTDENGWDDTNGEAWGSWSWDDVEFYVPLDGVREELE